MKMNVPEEYVPLIIKGLEHYYAYSRAVQRDDLRYQNAAHWFHTQLTLKSATPAKTAREPKAPQPRRRVSRR